MSPQHIALLIIKKPILTLNNLHTNFKISSTGEKLFLVDKFGFIVDSTKSILLSSDEVYQRFPDSAIQWGKSLFPTPNNRKLWRPKTNTGKWRWVFYDIYGGFGDYKYNMFHHMEDRYPDHSTTKLFKKLIKNNQFKSKFINSVCL